MIPLSHLLKLQWLYVILGVGYNLISLIVVKFGGQQLSTTDPYIGGPVMLLYGGFLVAAHCRYLGLYRCFMAASIIFYGVGGIVIHLVNYAKAPNLYSSFTAWTLAVGINVFGIGLSAVALSGKFKLN